MFGILKGILLTVIILFVLHYFAGIDINKKITQTGDYLASAWQTIEKNLNFGK